MHLGLVLGAGGTVGLAYHAGVLRALELVAGIRPDSAELIVGTSAGSVAGAYVRSGWTTEQLWQIALGTGPALAGLAAAEIHRGPGGVMAPAATNPFTLARRMVGSAYVAGRSLVPVPTPPLQVPGVLQRAFPGGVFAMSEGRRRFAEELPVGWPDKALWVCAVDLDRRRRVVLGRQASGRDAVPLASLQAAVRASCAIPGLYPPVRIGPLTLVDGAVHSSTNLELAAAAGCRVILGVAPMAYDTAGALPSHLTQLVRRLPARRVVGEMAMARRAGAEVLLIRPSAQELRIHGINLMRRSGWDLVAKAAYESAARQLETERFRRVLGDRAA